MCLSVVTVWSLLCSVCLVLGTPAQLVLLKDGISKGAVCLDGTPPGYYLRPGSGISGESKLILYMQGGGWCFDEDECVERSKTDLGSSKNWTPTASFSGFLSDDPQLNPLFYNWTLVFLKYCDGVSFSGNVDNVVNWKGTNLYFRGSRILNLAIDSIKAMGNFSEVILTGCSAGGLATYLHADHVSSLFPGAKFHALADAGFFLDAPNVNGVYRIRNVAKYVFNMQNCAGGLNQDCVKKLSESREEWKCFFPQYSQSYISSRLFALNSQYDTWQLANILQLNCLPPSCSPEQLKHFENYGTEFMEAAKGFTAREDHGYFLDSCLAHCQTMDDKRWTSISISGQTANETFAAWYYGGSGSGREVDCAYPCNHSC